MTIILKDNEPMVITLAGVEDNKQMETSVLIEKKPSEEIVAALYKNMMIVGKNFTNRMWIFWELKIFEKELSLEQFKNIINKAYES